jgi:hypothetical protein
MTNQIRERVETCSRRDLSTIRHPPTIIPPDPA